MVPHQLLPDLGPQPRPDRPGRHPHRPGRTPLATHRYTRLTAPGTTGAARASSQAPVNGHIQMAEKEVLYETFPRGSVPFRLSMSVTAIEVVRRQGDQKQSNALTRSWGG